MTENDRTDPLSGLISSATIGRMPHFPDHSLNPAKWMHERIVRSITTFEEQLDDEHEVGARLVTFGANLTFHIEDVGYWGPDMIVFYGVDQNNRRVELLQHVTQLSVLLIAVDKAREKARRIGFKLIESIAKDRT